MVQAASPWSLVFCVSRQPRKSPSRWSTVRMVACKRSWKQAPLTTGIDQWALSSLNLLPMRAHVAQRRCCEQSSALTPTPALPRQAPSTSHPIPGRELLRPQVLPWIADWQCHHPLPGLLMDEGHSFECNALQNSTGSVPHLLQGTEPYFSAFSGPCGERRGGLGNNHCPIRCKSTKLG